MGLFKKQTQEMSDKVDSLEVINTDLTSQVESLQAELVTAQEQAATLQTELTEANATIEARTETITQLETQLGDSANEQVDFETAVAVETAEVIADAGFETPVEEVEEVEENALDIFAGLKGSEKMKFYNENKEEIVRLSLLSN